MFYQFDDEIVGVDFDDINENILTFGFVSELQLKECYRKFDFSQKAVERCFEKSGFFSSDIGVYDNFSLVKLNIISLQTGRETQNRLAVFIKKNLVIIVNLKDYGFSNRDIFMKVLSNTTVENITIEKLVCTLFESLIADDTKLLEQAQSDINAIEERIINNNESSDFNARLVQMRKRFISLRSYYEQLINISEALRENENEIFNTNELSPFKIFTDKAVRLKSTADLLRESTLRLWDEYQTCLNMHLNKTMKAFTFVTTIFFPLTVIVGWYGMNFEYMPELHWRWGYLFVIAVSVAVVLFLFILFKKKKWI